MLDLRAMAVVCLVLSPQPLPQFVARSRAPTVFSSRIKPIRKENTVIDKSKGGLGLIQDRRLRADGTPAAQVEALWYSAAREASALQYLVGRCWWIRRRRYDFPSFRLHLPTAKVWGCAAECPDQIDGRRSAFPSYRRDPTDKSRYGQFCNSLNSSGCRSRSRNRFVTAGSGRVFPVS